MKKTAVFLALICLLMSGYSGPSPSPAPTVPDTSSSPVPTVSVSPEEEFISVGTWSEEGGAVMFEDFRWCEIIYFDQAGTWTSTDSADKVTASGTWKDGDSQQLMYIDYSAYTEDLPAPDVPAWFFTPAWLVTEDESSRLYVRGAANESEDSVTRLLLADITSPEGKTAMKLRREALDNYDESGDGGPVYTRLAYLSPSDGGAAVSADDVLWLDDGDEGAMSLFGLTPEDFSDDYYIFDSDTGRAEFALGTASCSLIQWEGSKAVSAKVDRETFLSELSSRGPILCRITTAGDTVVSAEEVNIP